MNFEFLLKDLNCSKQSAEIILETFVLNTSVQEFEMIKGMVEAKNLTKPKLKG